MAIIGFPLGGEADDFREEERSGEAGLSRCGIFEGGSSS